MKTIIKIAFILFAILLSSNLLDAQQQANVTLQLKWNLIEIFLLIVFIVALVAWFFYKTTGRLKKEIKQRILSETELHLSEEKYKAMADLLPQIVFETDVQGILVYVNKQAFKILGYPEDYPILGVNTLDFYTPESRKRAIENIQLRASGKSIIDTMPISP